MLLPTTATAVWVALAISLFGWGAWVCFYKATRRIRFEYLSYDFTWGVILAATLAAFTLGMWNSADLTFQDNFLLAGRRKMAWAGASGIVVNLGLMLLLASTSVSKISVSFPMAFAVAWATGSIWDYSIRPGVAATLAIGGAIVIIVAAIVSLVGYKWFLQDEAHRAIKALTADPRAKAAPPVDTSGKAAVLAILAGFAFALFSYSIAQATTGDDGVSPYGTVLILAGTLFASTIVFVPFFLNFPVRGKPLAVRQYTQLERRQHVMGVIAGIVWTIGLLAGLTTVGLPSAILPPPVVTYILNHSGFLLSCALGVALYREFPDAPIRVHAMTAAMFVLALAGMGMIAFSPI